MFLNTVRNFLFILFLILCTGILPAQEGMWLPQLVAEINGKEMHDMGMRLSADDIYSVNEGSLKDAIASFGGFCTSSVISPNGLLLTNHHCGYSAIQSHSTVDRNLLEDGYWASSIEEELVTPDLSATFIRRIRDVTDYMLQGVHSEMSEPERQSTIDKNRDSLLRSLEKAEFEEAEIKPFFHGNEYYLTVKVTYPDVRLVGTPPESIGKFGADTDNWEWPRHTGDFALFRVYADTNNRPAAYSEHNVPYTPDHYLPISLDGVSKGNFTMVFGFPGRTDEYLPALAVEQVVKVRNPARIDIREQALEIMDQAMKESEEVEIKYASKYAGLSNYWKKWIGENEGIERMHALDSIRAEQREFQKVLSRHADWSKKYGHILMRYEQLYEEMEPLAVYRDYHREIVGRCVELLRYHSILNQLVKIYENSGPMAFKQYAPRFEEYFKEQIKNYIPALDEKIFKALVEQYVEKMEIDTVLGQYSIQEWTDSIYTHSLVVSQDTFMEWFGEDPESAVKRLKSDPGYLFTKRLNEEFQRSVAPRLEDIQRELNHLDRLYMEALRLVFSEKNFYPDANGSMRVTFGQVKGYQPKDGIWYIPQTYLKGVMQKYVPGDYEFDVPDKLIELYENRDFGRYAERDRMPVCFLGTNHTTGGNSGSPVIDRYGNLIGLNFDRVWEGTMSDYYYDEEVCRNIMVDARYILFIIDKFAGADHLLKEMRLVRPNLN